MFFSKANFGVYKCHLGKLLSLLKVSGPSLRLLLMHSGTVHLPVFSEMAMGVYSSADGRKTLERGLGQWVKSRHEIEMCRHGI